MSFSHICIRKCEIIYFFNCKKCYQNQIISFSVGVGEPDLSSVDNYGSDDGFVGGDYGFFLLAPVGVSKSF